MNNRIPNYFQLDRFHIQPEDIVRVGLGCEPSDIHPTVILMPTWPIDIFRAHVNEIDTLRARHVFQLDYQGDPISVIRCGMGAPLAGDTVLALGCTPCSQLIFTGSVGGLVQSLEIGGLLMASRSLSGDGYSRYLSSAVVPPDLYLQPIEPDAAFTAHVAAVVEQFCRQADVPFQSATIVSVDSILGQFFRVHEWVKQHACVGIEMETAAVFRAARLVDIQACALLLVSDVIPKYKTLFSGRTQTDREHRHSIRENVVAKAILESIRTL